MKSEEGKEPRRGRREEGYEEGGGKREEIQSRWREEGSGPGKERGSQGWKRAKTPGVG